MAEHLANPLLARLGVFIAGQTGLHFPRERWQDLERGLGAAAREFGFEDAAACGQWLLSSPLTRSQVETLASHLTVGETYFFREKGGFEILEQHILPELIRSRRGAEQRLRIWSAGCCTGEEPYSIAIVLSQLLPDWRDWHITILATDINPRFLQKASEGTYGEWSFRDIPPSIKERYFKRTPAGRFKILPQLRKMVTFSYLNLAEDAYPSLLNNTNAVDVIFCRNVLMYFAPERAKQVVQGFGRSLVEGGWLIVSPSEISGALFAPFEAVHFPGAIFYRKPSRGSQLVEAFAPQARPIQPAASFLPAFQERGTLEENAQQAAQPPLMPALEAFALYEQGRYPEAEEKAIGRLSKNPEEVKTMALLARIYANRGRLAEALEWCERAIAADRLNPGSHYLYATIQQERGQAEEAVKSLRRALYLDPNFVLAHFALGNLTLRQGKYKEADKHFENALTLLSAHRQDDLLPEADGLTAGRLIEIIRSTVYRERTA